MLHQALRLWRAANVQEALSCLKQAAETHLLDDHADDASGVSVLLALQLSQLRRFHEAEAVLSALDDPTSTVLLANGLLSRGRYREASGLALVGLDAARELPADAPEQRTVVPIANLVLTVVNLRLGDLRSAQLYARRLSQDALFGRLSLVSAEAAWIATQVIEIEEGQEAASAATAAVIDGARSSYELFLSQPAAAPSLVRFALGSGDAGAAEELTHAANVVATRNPEVETLQVSAAHAAGLLHGTSEGLLRASVEHVDVWARALATEDAGALLATRRGERTAGVELFEKALNSYRAIGAARDVARVKAQLRGLRGHRPQATEQRPKRASPGRFGLTATEAQIVDLVAQGLTNGQAASQLFLSRHTIAYHLKSIFRKANVSSRGELISLWVRPDDEPVTRALPG